MNLLNYIVVYQWYTCQAKLYKVLIYISDTLLYNIFGVIGMPTEKPRYCITVDDEMLKEIDDFRFNNRFNSRSQATIELIRLGLQNLKEQKVMIERPKEGK